MQSATSNFPKICLSSRLVIDAGVGISLSVLGCPRLRCTNPRPDDWA